MKNYKSDQPCIVCGQNQENKVTYHHIYTRKGFPEFESSTWNMIPVCQPCHCLFHSIGNQGMMRKYVCVRTWMELNDWEVFNGKLIHKG
jgi:hypothetical protein